MSLFSEHFYWRNRKKYHQLMKYFLDKKISGIEFDSQFCDQWCMDRGQYSKSERENNFKKDETIIFDPDSRAAGFEELVSSTYTACDAFNPDGDLEDYELDEEGLRAWVQDIFPKIDKYCNES